MTDEYGAGYRDGVNAMMKLASNAAREQREAERAYFSGMTTRTLELYKQLHEKNMSIYCQVAAENKHLRTLLAALKVEQKLYQISGVGQSAWFENSTLKFHSKDVCRTREGAEAAIPAFKARCEGNNLYDIKEGAGKYTVVELELNDVGR